MCMEDVRLARQTTTFTRLGQTGDGSHDQLVPYRANRYSLEFIIRVVAAAGFGCEALSPVTSDFPNLGVGNYHFLYDLQHHGDLVRQPFGIYPVGDFAYWSIIETILEKQ